MVKLAVGRWRYKLSSWSLRILPRYTMTPGPDPPAFLYLSYLFLNWFTLAEFITSSGSVFHTLTALLVKKCSLWEQFFVVCPESLLLWPLIPWAGPGAEIELHGAGGLINFAELMPFINLNSWIISPLILLY